MRNSPQQFNKGIFDYLIAVDDQNVTDTDTKEVGKKSQAGNTKKREREQNEENGVARGIDFKGVHTILSIDAPDQTDA